MPGMRAVGCANWQMMDPSLMGPGLMGWMWAPNAATALPNADSKGGGLVANYCSQCHAPPSPGLHTRKEWGEVTTCMRAHTDDEGKSAGWGVKIPSPAELDAITGYLGEHARQ
jgi:hypothetical protein